MQLVFFFRSPRRQCRTCDDKDDVYTQHNAEAMRNPPKQTDIAMIKKQPHRTLSAKNNQCYTEYL